MGAVTELVLREREYTFVSDNPRVGLHELQRDTKHSLCLTFEL
jgi:hypothetical protein